MERTTRQRRALSRILAEAGRPLNAIELLDLARLEVPGIGQATVYRTLKDLIKHDEAILVEIPGAVPAYEHSHRGHHHHFHCTVCTKIFEVDGCVPGIEGIVPSGFQLTGHEIILSGRCVNCVI